MGLETDGKKQVLGFRDLHVWQHGMSLVEDIYRLTEKFPPHELYGLTNQLRRSAVSIPSNIAEGHSRTHLPEYLHHLSIAHGSLAELTTQVEIAVRLGYAPHDHAAQVLDFAASLAKQLHALRTALEKKQKGCGRHPSP